MTRCPVSPWASAVAIALAISQALAMGLAGCVSYEPRPLDPAVELAALGQQSLVGFVVERGRPGAETDAAPAPFDLSDGLSESELVAIALTLNPELRAKRLEVGEAQALQIAAGLWPNPQVGIGARPGIGGTAGYNLDADLLLELLRPGDRAARKDIAEARMAEAEAGILAEEWKLVAETRLQGMQVLAAEQTVALLKEETALRERALELVRRRKELGEGIELDVSAAELEVAEVRRDLRHADTELGTAYRELNRLLGLPPAYALRLTDSGRPLTITVFDELSDEDVDQRLLAGRFDLRALERAYERAEHELRLAVYRQYSRFLLGPSFGHESDGGKFFGLGLGLELPIFDRNQAELAEKLNQRERARADYVARLHALRADAYEARGRLRGARLEVEAQEAEVLPLVQRNQELFEGAFRARELNVLDWVTAQQRALRARRAYIESLVRYRNTVIQFEAATGVPLARRLP